MTDGGEKNKKNCGHYLPTPTVCALRVMGTACPYYVCGKNYPGLLR